MVVKRFRSGIGFGVAAQTSPAGVTAFAAGRSMTSSVPATAPLPTPTARSAEPSQGHRFRRPRYLVPLAVLAILTLVIGFYAFRVREAFNTINSVSTMAPAVSGAALGGSANLTIDTGPAQTAMAGGFVSAPTSTETPEPESTDRTLLSSPTTNLADSNATSTAEPTIRATDTEEPTTTIGPGVSIESTEVATDDGGAVVAAQAAVDSESTNTIVLPTEEPSPAATNTAEPSETPEPTATAKSTATATASVEPTAMLSEIDRVKNGDFEQGPDNWYVEQGAAVLAREAHGGENALTIGVEGGYADQHIFFVPETTYHLSVWAKLSSDDGETAEFGINFLDQGGNRLSDLEPATTTIKSGEWTETTYSFLAPTGAERIQIYFWKPSGSATLFVDDVSIRSIVPPEALDVEIQKSDEDSMTILIMGVDAREGEAIDIGVRPDSLMVMHLDAATGSCRLLSIPRDTRTDLPGYGMTKVNHALAVGGIDYQIKVVEQMLGLGVDHYVLIDFNGFEDLVDAVGGITVDVPEPFTSSDGQQFSAGRQEMTGKQALSYARWRGGPDGDFGRIQRQQQILRALVQRASGLNIVGSINELLPAVEENLRTDLSATEMTSVAMDYRSRCTDSTISMTRLEGFDAVYNDPMLQMNLYYIEVDAAEIRRKVAALTER
jgi:LCP family protein required for cell wall assembly